jgi:hypothetical protein
MHQPHFWRKQGSLLTGLFLASYTISLGMTALFPTWPPVGVLILGGVVLAILWNLFICAWKYGDTTSKTRHLADQATELALGLGLLAAFFVTLLSFSTDAPPVERWVKLGLMCISLSSGIMLVFRPLRTILFFTTKPWRR